MPLKLLYVGKSFANTYEYSLFSSNYVKITTIETEVLEFNHQIESIKGMLWSHFEARVSAKRAHNRV